MNKIIPNVPFFKNTEDDTHCFQASIASILGYFLPNKEFSFDQLDDMSAKQPGLPTWPQAMLLELTNLGFEIHVKEGFNGPDFIKKGEKYLINAFGKESAEWMIKNSDINKEREIYKRLLSKDIDIKNEIPNKEDIIAFINEGFLVQATVNSRSLNNKLGYVGHSVVIFGYDDRGFIIHDPGLPPLQNRFVSYKDFNDAWADPNDNAKNAVAIRLKDTK